MSAKRKRLNHDDRANIAGYLAQGLTVPKIAKRTGWAASTIYREINRNPQIKETYKKNICKLRPSKYYCCNQCPKHNQCRLNKKYYNLKMAIDDAHKKKHDSHAGPKVTTSQLKKVNDIITKGIGQGQSIEYIYQFNKEIQFVSCLTIRRWIEHGYLTTKRCNLRRARRYTKKYAKKRISDSMKSSVDSFKTGRTFTDYLDYIEKNKNYILMELDSVEGHKSSKKRLFTFMFVKEAFQIGKLYDLANASQAVLEEAKKIILTMMKYSKDKDLILLCDNGIEFPQLPLIEKLSPRIKVFYTNTYKSTDKPHCERNHEYFRYVCPKGYSFDDWTQDEMDKVFSNINSYSRKELKWKRPYDLFVESYCIEAAIELNISEIAANDVNLSSRF